MPEYAEKATRSIGLEQFGGRFGTEVANGNLIVYRSMSKVNI